MCLLRVISQFSSEYLDPACSGWTVNDELGRARTMSGPPMRGGEAPRARCFA
jgi:hypothetical protein